MEIPVSIFLLLNGIGDNMAKEFTCAAPGCKFRIRSNVDDEVVNAAIWHAKTSHKTDMSKEDVMKMLKVA